MRIKKVCDVYFCNKNTENTITIKNTVRYERNKNTKNKIDMVYYLTWTNTLKQKFVAEFVTDITGRLEHVKSMSAAQFVLLQKQMSANNTAHLHRCNELTNAIAAMEKRMKDYIDNSVKGNIETMQTDNKSHEEKVNKALRDANDRIQKIVDRAINANAQNNGNVNDNDVNGATENDDNKNSENENDENENDENDGMFFKFFF